MAIFYHIVPENDGYHFVGQNLLGEECLLHKARPIDSGELIFSSKEQAQDYIDTTLTLEGEFRPEECWRSDSFVCPSCGGPLKIQYAIGADVSSSGYTERLCSCERTHCNLDWYIITDESNEIIDIRRYFFG